MKVETIRVQWTPDGNNPQTLTLDGVRVMLEFYTNKADGAWYFDTLSADGTLLVVGIAIVAGLDLWYPYRYKDGIPPGQLFVAPLSDPTLTSFEDAGSKLVYMPVS